MIWALLFTLILNNDPIFIFPNLEKHTKNYIEDNERKQEILEIYKYSKKIRKSFSKDKRKRIKRFNKLNLSRNVTREELTKLFEIQKSKRHKHQQNELERILKIKSLITNEEWDLFLKGSKKDIEKELKEKKKKQKSLQKLYSKATKKVNNCIKSDTIRQEMQTIVEVLYNNSNNYLEVYFSYLQNTSSIVYKHQFTKDELIEASENLNTANDKVLQSIIDAHFEALDLTTEKEWKKLIKPISKF